MMPTTDPNEFDKWIACFSSEMKEKLQLIPITPLAKEPAIPRNESWKDEKFRLAIAEARQRLETGGNVGAVANKGSIGFLDIEYRNIQKAKPHVPNELVDTLINKTRDAGLHLTYVNEDVENKDLRINGELLIEARMENRYVLAPGSFVPPSDGSLGNGLYHVVNERPPLILKREMLPWLNETQNRNYVPTPVNFAGKFMSLPCVKLLFQIRLKVGRRTRASKLLAIAWRMDHGSTEGFEKVADAYANFQSDDEVLVKRGVARAWGGSVARNKRDWNCGEMITILRDNGIFPPCSGCPMREAL